MRMFDKTAGEMGGVVRPYIQPDQGISRVAQAGFEEIQIQGEKCHPTLPVAAIGPSEIFRPADSNESRLGTAPCRTGQGADGRFEPGRLGKANGFGDRAQRNAPAPALVADKIS